MAINRVDDLTTNSIVYVIIAPSEKYYLDNVRFFVFNRNT